LLQAARATANRDAINKDFFIEFSLDEIKILR
jgi:hypothetical protein